MPRIHQSRTNRSADQPHASVEHNQPYSLDDSLKTYNRLTAGLQPASTRPSNLFIRSWQGFWNHHAPVNNPLKLRDYKLKWRVLARNRYGIGFFLILVVQGDLLSTRIVLIRGSKLPPVGSHRL